MRITFILPTPDMGGGIRVISIHAQALADRGHQVVMISQPRKPTSWRQKIRYVRDQRGWDWWSARVQSHLDHLNLDHRVLERWRPPRDSDVPDADIVIATWWETAEWVSALSPTKGAKVYFVQGHEVHLYLPVARVRATYRLPMHKIVVAQWLKDVMASEYGDTVVDGVPNSIDRDQFNASPRGKQSVPTIGFLYSTAHTKGLNTALAAINVLRARIPKFRLISFGAARPHRDYPLPEGTEFFRAPPQDQIRNLYSKCDVWVSASRSEGFNLPAMEAMACRTPVVGTRTGWPAEVLVTGKNGVLVNVDDVAGIVQGVEWVLSLADDAWRELSASAFATSSTGSWEESSRQFERALRNACGRAARGEIAGKCNCPL